jgi:hypothetical protein
MTNPFFQVGAAFAALVLFSFVALEGKNVAQSIGLAEQDEPVLVFTIPDSAQLARVQKAIPPDRILRSDNTGFAVKGGRVYVHDIGQAGDFIEEAGWIEQPIQIVGLGMDEPKEGSPSTPPAMNDVDRLAYLRGLVNKPTLSRSEQIFVLQAMNDGLEI